ncbi:MAG: hypothetical protein H6Q56_1049 [Deltaproteobacteria bacterium]|nr:hypothetical protein [Deltaproteobacteria bacterium]
MMKTVAGIASSCVMKVVVGLIALLPGVMPLYAQKWYVGEERCPPPRDDGTYAAPYNALEHPYDYPDFPGADKPGWSCSYQREDGVIIQYGDGRTPQEQWQGVWGGLDNGQ